NASQYAPTYYGDTTTWTQADSFNLPANATSFLVIDLCANQGGTGGGTIGGGVAGNLPRLSGPLAGIQVQLINTNGMNPVSHRRSVRTGPAGSFAFTNIPYGSYLLRCEHPGMHSVMVPITLSAGSPTHNSTIFNAGSNGFTASTSSVGNLDLGVAMIYPNPLKSGHELIIHWNVADFVADFASDKPLILFIRDLQGKVCVRQEISPNNEGPMGGQSLTFRAGLSTSGLKAGIYTLDLHHFSGITKVFRLVVEP
ncbi:MAG: carboxypeptidase-like regulatory domain-containing protein, partial [Bacteroidota bacterium]